MPQSAEEMSQNTQGTQDVQQAQPVVVSLVEDSLRCQVAIASIGLLTKIVDYFKQHGMTEGVGKNQYELYQREMADGKQALVIKVPGDQSSLKEFLEFLKEEGVKIVKTVVAEIKKLFEKEPGPFLKGVADKAEKAAEKAENLFGGNSGPGHGLTK